MYAVGPAQPAITKKVIGVESMGLSSTSFLLGADNMLHALAGAAFMRMLHQEEPARLPDFAGQRVRVAGLVVETANGEPLRVLHRNFSILNIGDDGLLDTGRFNAQQMARFEAYVTRGQQASRHPRRSLTRRPTSSRAAASGSRIPSCCGGSRMRRWAACAAAGCGSHVDASSLVRTTCRGDSAEYGPMDPPLAHAADAQSLPVEPARGERRQKTGCGHSRPPR